MKQTLLVELLTEELPPQSLAALARALADGLLEALRRDALADADSRAQPYATPRRLAATVTGVREEAPARERVVHGPPAEAPAAAVAGFARRHGVAVEALVRADSARGPVWALQRLEPGVRLDAVLAARLEEVLRRLPAPKLMRWGAGEAQFVRPVHGVTLLHGARPIPGTVLGLAAGAVTRGHRFLAPAPIALDHAEEYEERLAREGHVIADFAKRREAIERALAQAAAARGAVLAAGYEALLEEVTALVEAPAVYVGRFDPEFLELPEACIELTLRRHQRHFPLRGPEGRLRPEFLIVSNMPIADASRIVAGNERVVRPRLEDARFFYAQDRRERLEERVPRLARVVYHGRLGSQLERVERLQLLAGRFARELGADPAPAERAAWLAKADLLTAMVGEFPELQGTMGAIYARADGEPEAVCEAIGDQYRLRYAGASAANAASASLYAAERVEALVGLFGAGHAPSGDKDPYGLRRAALDLIALYEALAALRPGARLPDVAALAAYAAGLFAPGTIPQGTVEAVLAFVRERHAHGLAPAFAADAIEAVLALAPPIEEVRPRLAALERFRRLPEAAALAVANKRIGNLLRRSAASSASAAPQEALLVEAAERSLWHRVQQTEPQVARCLAARDYGEALATLAALAEPLDAFFAQVLVNTEEAQLRENRFALLRRLARLLNAVAELGRLSGASGA